MTVEHIIARLKREGSEAKFEIVNKTYLQMLLYGGLFKKLKQFPDQVSQNLLLRLKNNCKKMLTLQFLQMQ